MSRRQTQTDSFQSSNSDFCIEETKEKGRGIFTIRSSIHCHPSHVMKTSCWNLDIEKKTYWIDASDEDGSCGHLIQNSLNYPWRCKKVKLIPVVQKQKVILTFMNI